MQQMKLKLLEIGKTRTKNASYHMFKFYVVLTGRATAGLPRAGKNSKPHHYKQMVQKMKDLPKTWVPRGKPFEDFRRKKTETFFSTFQKTPVTIQDPKAINWISPF